jgi:hypothetical protein
MKRSTIGSGILALMTLLAGSIAAVGGCGGGGGVSLGTCPPGSEADQAAGHTLVINECQSCHDSSLTGTDRAGAPVGKDYDVPSVVTATGPLMYERLQDPDFPMPPIPDGPLSPAEIEQIRIWLACGASFAL